MGLYSILSLVYTVYTSESSASSGRFSSIFCFVTIRNISVPETAMNILAIPNGTSKNQIVLLALLLSSYH